MEISLALKQFRQSLRITQKEMAESIGIAEKQYWQYERGLHEIPVRYLVAICDAWNASADVVLGRCPTGPGFPSDQI